jgi:glycosyltransferase involved in cell wall biosynthesis
MRIIHIVENLDKGAVENWLVNIFIRSRKYRPDWDWTFYCILGNPGQRDAEVISSGGHIIYSPVSISRKRGFLMHLRSALKNGNFDIIHSHHDYLSGFYLLASIGIPYQKRILHIHNNDRQLPVASAFLHEMACRIFGFTAMALSNMVIGISVYTLRKFVKGKLPKVDEKCVLYYGVDLDWSKYFPSHINIREDLNVNDHTRILLFAGRLNPEKNPFFCLEILEEMRKRMDDVVLIVVGEGGEKARMQSYASMAGISDRLFFLGWRRDIKSIMLQADIFLFPRIESIMEGLGIVVVEAQAAGLPMVISKGIVNDAIVINELANVIGLSEGAITWADKVRELLATPIRIKRSEANAIMNRSSFSLDNGCLNLISIYDAAIS